MKRCVICGTELKQTTFGRYFCSNCGMIEENQDNFEDKGSKEASYIG
jgi:predicted RNA-binding Zn-ribbon protein involved in translation (DUF1610 family)